MLAAPPADDAGRPPAAPPLRPSGIIVALGEDSSKGRSSSSRALSKKDATPWLCLEQQLGVLMAKQDESRRSVEEQLMQLSALRGFARRQARLVGEPVSASSRRRQGGDASPASSEGVSAFCEAAELADLPSRMSKEDSHVAAAHEDHGGRGNDCRYCPGSVVAAASEVAEDAIGDMSTMKMPTDISEEAMGPKKTMPVLELNDYGVPSVTEQFGHPRSLKALPPLRNGVWQWVRVAANNLLHWRFFEPLMGLVITINAVNIGWAIDAELRHHSTEVQNINEAIFLTIFTVELVLRIIAHGFRCLRVYANAFDFSIVAVTFTAMTVEPLLALSGKEDWAQYLQHLLVLRMLRLLRLARAVRLIQSFRSLWKLVQGLWHCFGTMMSAVLLMFISIYIFACFGAELITKPLMDDPTVGPMVTNCFSTLPKIILTLCQFIAMDSTAEFYVPLIHRSPGLAIYFALLLIIVSIALLNLVTALLVEDAISKAQMDEEMKGHFARQRIQALKPAIHSLFEGLDRNGDGSVQIQEIVEAIRTGAFHVPSQLREIINPARMLDLYEAIDSDQSGDISEDELVMALSKMALTDVSLETMQTLHLLRMIKKDLKKLEHHSRATIRRGRDLIDDSLDEKSHVLGSPRGHL